MTIVGKADVPDRKAFREGLVSRDDLVEKAKFISQCANATFFHLGQLGWESEPGFSETESGDGGTCEVSAPLPDECVVVLLHGQMQLDDDERVLTGTNVAVRTQGSKTLRILTNSAAVWYPGMCCWDPERCARATKGQCKRLGIGNVKVKKSKKSPWSWVNKKLGLGKQDKNS
ncbi:hypothetical protein F5Y11DRAFT_365038 [Daldinia sp. FL1419]|nr:hypothetical protein F5Y11DRAFT_365038 [Daldinia sp. FL1419]